MAMGDDVWDSYNERLTRYASPLSGWWTPTETITQADAVLLMHRSRCRQFVRYLDERTDRNLPVPPEGAAVVEFVRSGQVATFYSFSLEWGALRDADIGARLQDATAEIPLEQVIDSLAAVQFYDACPPMPMLLEIIWGELFSMKDNDSFDQRTRSWPVMVNVDSFTTELQRAYGSRALSRDERSCEFPTRGWIRQALDELVSLGLAEQGSTRDDYKAHVKAFEGGDVRSEFVRRMFDRYEREATQTSMPRGAEQTSLPL
jgi:hypothetical protein